MTWSLVVLGALLALAVCGANARLPIPELSNLAKAGKLDATPVVQTVNGQVTGIVDDEVFLYLGMPFAAPPTGENRFKSPQPPQNWTGVYNANSFGNICVQYPKVLDIHLGAEDCLFVNVYTPADAIERAAAGNPYPVMFWIYGGAYILGDGYEFGLYDARNIVSKRGVIVVTSNYRLGVFGFMAHDALRAEDPDNSTGSYGVQDQRAAMQWVQANIAAFGGNPNAVTIYGESAGAFSVCYHLASSASAGLFSAAIMESGNCDSSDFFQPYELAATFGDIYADACGCDSRKMTPPQFLSCIRGLSVSDLLKDITTWLNPNWPYPLIDPAQKEFAQKAAIRRGMHQAHHEHRQQAARGGVGRDPYVPLLSPAMPWGIAIDGTTKGLKGRPIDLLPDTVNDVPLIIGTNTNEGSIFILLLPLVVPGGTFPINDKTLNLTLTLFFNSSVAEEAMTTVYPAAAYKDDDHRAGILLRDFFFVCPTRRAARALYDNKDTATFVYQFRYHEDWPETPILGDYHSSELEFVFDNEWPPILHTFSANDTIIADTFNTYWTNHAKFHDPNGNSVSPGPAVWPEYNTTTEVNLAIDIPLAYEYDLIGSRCDFWDRVGDHVPSRVFKRQP